MGRSTSYTLRYDHGAVAPGLGARARRHHAQARRLLRAGARPATDGRTLVTYHLAVDLIVPLPGFVKRRAEQKIIHTALRELRAHVEAR